MKITFFIITIISVITLIACGDTIAPEKVKFPDEDVSYMAHVEPFMKANCAYYGCHGVNSPGAELSDYNYLMNAMSYIIPGNANGSLVNQILEKRLPHPGSYPIYFGNITDNQIEGMRTWVEEGAKNN